MLVGDKLYRNLYRNLIVCVKLNTIEKKRIKKYGLKCLIQRAGLSEFRTANSGASGQSRARKRAREINEKIICKL